ncbi:MAG: DNA-processing protein DprA [[Clostridium] innocuum]|nr:DNA-processing protein DprA [[Clostridium] innocuum]MBS5685853.1 DNA-processing protein DprA [[Clostridium] innocuum]
MNRDQLLFYAVKYQGEWWKINKAVTDGEPWKLLKYSGSYMTICDLEYPDKLRELEQPPWILFYEGDITFLNTYCSSIMGPKNVDIYGLSSTRAIAESLKGHTIVTGLSLGVQTEAYRHADRKIVVMGSGLDVPYPLDNKSLIDQAKREHVVITEYPKGTKPYAYHFPWRNRLIAALSEECYIINAKEHSGTMLFAREAQRLERSVYAVSHPYDKEYQEGYEILIQEGALDFTGCDTCKAKFIMQ